MNKMILFIIMLIFNIFVCNSCYAAASSPFRFTDSSDLSSNDDKEHEVSLPAIVEKFNVEIPYITWYGKKKKAMRVARMALCLTLREKGARDMAQKALLDFIKEDLGAQKNICPAHLDNLLAQVITNAVRDKSVLEHGTPLECEFNITIDKKTWHGRAEVINDIWFFNITRSKAT